MSKYEPLIAVAAIESIIKQSKKIRIDPCVVIGLRIALDRLQSIPYPQSATSNPGAVADDLDDVDDDDFEEEIVPRPLPLPRRSAPSDGAPIQF